MVPEAILKNSRPYIDLHYLVCTYGSSILEPAVVEFSQLKLDTPGI